MGSYPEIKKEIETGIYPDLIVEKLKQLKSRRRFMKGYIISLCVSIVTVSASLIFSEAIDSIPFFAKIKSWLQGAIALKATVTIGTLTILLLRSLMRYRKILNELKSYISATKTQ